MDSNVVGVVTVDAGLANRNTDYCDVGDIAADTWIPVLRVRRIADESALNGIRAMRPDVILVLGFSQLLPLELLEIPPLGCVGSHPALLPRNRGRHPLIWALVEGLEKSGLTFFYLDEGADSGDILWQREFPIRVEDDAAALYDRIETLAVEGLREFVPQLAAGTAPRTPQDHGKASYWRKRGEADGEIHWAARGMVSYNLIRALTRPYPGAHTWNGARRLIAWRASHPEIGPLEGIPGTILSVSSEGVRISTGDGAICITKLHSEDGRQTHLRPGDILTQR